VKKSTFIIATLIFSLYLTGCARNNANDDVTANNQNLEDITRVNYNNPNQVGPAISGSDTTDPELDRNRNNNRTTNVRNENNAGNTHTDTRVADLTAVRVSKLTEVDDAEVIVTDNNAYVAARLNRTAQNELTSDIRNKITRAVKSADNEVDNVYISINPDFYQRMNAYCNEIRNDRPNSGFTNEFSDTIRRIFPNAR
jgi:spore cortex protein